MCRKPTSDEISFLLNTVNTALDVALGPDDVIGTYAGLRPLIDTAEGRTADVLAGNTPWWSHARGVISVIGGKLTEYRFMAEDVLDRAGGAQGSARKSVPHPQPAARRCTGQPGGDAAVHRPTCPARWSARYGAEAPNVIAMARCERPTQPVADGIDVTRAEFEYAVTHEGCTRPSTISSTGAPASASFRPTVSASPRWRGSSSPASVSRCPPRKAYPVDR